MQTGQTSDDTDADNSGYTEEQLLHDKQDRTPKFSTCKHNCGGLCTREHTCDVVGCSRRGKQVNEWRNSGGNWATHMKASSKHPNCTSACPGNASIVAWKVKKENEKRQKGKRKAEDDETETDNERKIGAKGSNPKSRATVDRKRNRIVSDDDDDEQDDEASATTPAASVSQSDMAMDVDVPDIPDTSRTATTKPTNILANIEYKLRFDIVVVLDVNGRCEHRDVARDTAWMKIEVMSKEAKEMLADGGLTGFVKLYKDTDDGEQDEPDQGYVFMWIYDRASANPGIRSIHAADANAYRLYL